MLYITQTLASIADQSAPEGRVIDIYSPPPYCSVRLGSDGKEMGWTVIAGLI